MSGFGIYLHWPYCAAICPYCDFNVYRARGASNAPLIAAMENDLAAHALRFGKREAQSLFFGGGTPSLLRGEEIVRLIDAASRAFTLAAACEITLEANPEDAALFAEQAEAGINRFSVGVQALDDAALRALGRRHDAAAAIRAVEAAARTHRRVSIDMIYAREAQGLDAWLGELKRALALPIEHASLYQLTIEPETAFARRLARGDLNPPELEEAAELYDATQAATEALGFPAYEISNHARAPQAHARHNEIYWRSGDWIGIGPGAHGRVTHDGVRLALEAQRRPADYIDAVAENGIGAIVETPLTAEETADERLLMGIRLTEGVEIAPIEALRGRPLNRAALTWLAENGLVRDEAGRVQLTARGRTLTNRIVAELVF
jgi:oxygen-independent coproporphyrinogen-3 oxidase